MAKRVGFWILLALAGLLSFYVYLGERGGDRAMSAVSSAEAAGVQNTSGGFFWLNDRLYHARGKALFEQGVGRLGEPALRDGDFRLAYRNYLRSLTLNPFSATTHFDFAQALQYLNALDFPSAERYIDEYHKAADLSGVDTSIYGEVGKVLLSRWSGLTSEDRLFSQEIYRSLLSIHGPDQEKRLDSFLNLWELNVRDAAVLEKTLPPDALILRRTAQFLGGKGIFEETRLSCLAKAETLEFRKASDEAQIGLSNGLALHPAEALEQFRSADRLLDGIRFVKDLSSGGGDIAPADFRELRQAVKLGILKARVEMTSEPKDYFEDFRAYLDVEDSVGAIGEVETLLKSRGVVNDQSATGFLDFNRLNFKLLLNFKQNRFRDVAQMGESLSRNLLVIPDDERRPYGRMFELVGDACQRLDNLYESNAYYEKALGLGAEDPVIRIKMRRNFERLNEEASIKSVQALIDAELAPRETILTAAVWKAGEAYSPSLVLDEKSYRLRIEFSDASAGAPLLLSIVFNGKIVAEDFVKLDAFEVALPAVLGHNTLEIMPLNRDCRPVRIALVPEEEPADNGEDQSASRIESGRRGRG
jgi:tetratricopeptide (TPR) repeat protein